MSLATLRQGDVASSTPDDRVTLRCPRCAAVLGPIPDVERNEVTIACASCSFLMACTRGIWNALPQERECHYERFVSEYQIVRRHEGRGSSIAEYYTSLPYRDITGANQKQWQIRAKTYRHLEERILPRVESSNASGITVLDLGAGNGWLSYRLALRGDRPVAVDLLVNDTDGLGAAEHYLSALPRLFPRFRAEFDRLPFADHQFDCAIFNASFHYSENYERTLKEAIRCVRSGGTVIVCDSPWYSDDASGRRMVEERQSSFTARFGFPSDGLPSREYLTDAILDELERTCGIQWEIESPFYGLRWALRPIIARLKRRREPSKFRIYFAEVRK